MKTNKEQEATDAENEKQYKKSLKDEKVAADNTPEKKVVESGVTDGQGNFVAYDAEGKVPADRKKEVADWGHTYKTFQDDTTVID